MNVNTASNALVDFAGKTFKKTFGVIGHAFKESSNRDMQRSHGHHGASWEAKDVISVTKYKPLTKPRTITTDNKLSALSQNQVKTPVSINKLNAELTKAHNPHHPQQQHFPSGYQSLYPSLDLEFLIQGIIPPNRRSH
ncbi:hypothetical protein SJI19_13985 [Acerihabitans sp. TG2]|uniref:hypothetical protein n=1 Tax=Acerihabitans sp. TG2 TaxID=3096008 RepID=UPI002B22CF00|nr:hypothetical protein [Acerihabitans sp. TG2]MEA9391641.1 hypothetical protein [Acerihabitans sp. TG2]